MEQTRSSAPVSARSEIDIDASDRDVWMVLADVASWPTWNPAIRHAVRDDDLEIGTRFRFSTELGTLKCRFTAVDAPHALSWKGRVLALRECQSWRLTSTPTGTHVVVEAEMTGPVAWMFRKRLTERLQLVLEAVVALLRLEAEVRATEEREDAARGLASAPQGPPHD